MGSNVTNGRFICIDNAEFFKLADEQIKAGRPGRL